MHIWGVPAVCALLFLGVLVPVEQGSDSLVFSSEGDEGRFCRGNAVPTPESWHAAQGHVAADSAGSCHCILWYIFLRKV